MAAVSKPEPDRLLTKLSALPAGARLVAALDGERTDVYLVGGAVRDLLLGLVPRELDLLVEDDPAPLLATLGADAVRGYDRFGTASFELDGLLYDIARARAETYDHPGALPTVEPATVGEDLRRRDFTVNAIAVAISGTARGELQNAPSAFEDLDARRLAVLHDASFIDDPTRLLRMALYAARLRFTPAPHTATLAREAIAGGALNTVSGARVGAELRRLAGEPDPVAALGALAELGLDEAIEPGFGLRDAEPARQALRLLPADGDHSGVALAAASLQLPGPALAAMLDRLSFEAHARDRIIAAATNAAELARSLAAARRPSEVAAIAVGVPIEAVALAGALDERALASARQWLAQLRCIGLEIDGRDLLAEGVASGPAIGRGLRAALAAKLDGHAPDRERQLEEAIRAASGGR
jgi:tRNA nucleotidyltransferase (CCA-adding enzyme)